MRQAGRGEPRDQRAAWLHRHAHDRKMSPRRIDDQGRQERVQLAPQRTANGQSLDLDVAEAAHGSVRIDGVDTGQQRQQGACAVGQPSHGQRGQHEQQQT